jgi:hypothetical protein
LKSLPKSKLPNRYAAGSKIEEAAILNPMPVLHILNFSELDLDVDFGGW